LHEDVTRSESQSLIHSQNLPETVPISGRIEGDRNCKGYLGYKSMTLEERLEIWILAHCTEENPRPQRVAELNAVFRSIYCDRRFWRYRNSENYYYYEEALSLMWQFFMRNLCEATTAKKNGSFLETRSFAVGRLLISLKGNLQNLCLGILRDASRREQPRLNDDGTIDDPVDGLVYPEPAPDPEPDPQVVFKVFLKLIAEDSEGELNHKDNTLRGRKINSEEFYELTAQRYLLMRYQENKGIQQIADELCIPRGSVQGGVKPKRWKELARKYAQMAKNLVSERGK
jgi:hypothetical protein